MLRQILSLVIVALFPRRSPDNAGRGPGQDPDEVRFAVAQLNWRMEQEEHRQPERWN